MSYAEFASSLPSGGAEHGFLREALPRIPSIAFAIGLFIAVHGAATFATVGLTFGSYFRTFLPFEISVSAPDITAAIMAAGTRARDIMAVGPTAVDTTAEVTTDETWACSQS